ncbi:MAG: MarR family transcriptional regulator [Phenylobacterium sp.]|nr:MAG: MarR family transcriptional regulator [Phenylobacterium sp.]
MGHLIDQGDLAARLQRLVFRLNRELRWEFAELGVTGADAMLLFDLRRRPGSGVSDLAAMGEVARSVMSERIKRLEKAGLVARDDLPRADKRRVGLVVTPEGLAVMLRIVHERRDRMETRLARLAPAERLAVSVAVEALDKLPDWRSAFEIQDEQQQTNPGEGHHERKRAKSA